MFGANVSYKLTHLNKSAHVPTHWINKRNLTTIHIDKELGNVRFFHTQVIDEIGHENIIYYVESFTNKIDIFECRHVWESAEVFCRD